MGPTGCARRRRNDVGGGTLRRFSHVPPDTIARTPGPPMQTPMPPPRPARTPLPPRWLLLALLLFALAAGIGLRDPSPPDEPRFVLAASAMVDSGDWLLPRRGREF